VTFKKHYFSVNLHTTRLYVCSGKNSLQYNLATTLIRIYIYILLFIVGPLKPRYAMVAAVSPSSVNRCPSRG